MGSDHAVRVRGITHLVADVVALDCIDLESRSGRFTGWSGRPALRNLLTLHLLACL
jgi:hypothetical protein